MAKDRYNISETVDLVGLLDYDQNDRLVVAVEHGRGDDAIVVNVDLLEVLIGCVGRQISLKLTEEKDACYDR